MNLNRRHKRCLKISDKNILSCDSVQCSELRIIAASFLPSLECDYHLYGLYKQKALMFFLVKNEMYMLEGNIKTIL
jgi:hypothetical protein